MKKTIAGLLVVGLLGALLAAGCGNNTVESKASEQITAAKASLADANAKGVKVPDADEKKIGAAEAALKKDSVNALILATQAKANIDNDINDAFAIADQTLSTASGAAQAAMSNAPAGTDFAQAKQSLANADAKKAQAKTIQDYYNPTDGPIYWANLAAQQAAAAALAKAGQQATAAEIQKVQQGAAQMLRLMSNYISSTGANPADYKIGIQKISADANWATGSATPVAAAPGSKPISFLFQFENGNWVLRAAPTWTPGQFGSPADMLP